MKTKLWKTFINLIAPVLLTPIIVNAQGLINTSGTYLVANGSVYLVINDAGFKNDGTFLAGTGTVAFTGSEATSNSFISGAGATSFNNLTINKTNNGVQLNNNISVSGTINLQNGDSLFLNSYNIDLGLTGFITGETNSRRITGLTGGYVQTTQTLNGPSAVNPGNMGFEITSAADLGSTVIRRGNQQQSGASIDRYFDIIPTNNSALNASINLLYNDAELEGIAEGNLGVFSSTDGGISWNNLGIDGLNIVLNVVTKNGLNQLNRLTLSDISKPLAVHLVSFTARQVNKQILLNWVTDGEFNNDHFEIERSHDGITFTTLVSINGTGNNSNLTCSYEYIDNNPFLGENYYRLKQVDKDGHFAYFKILLVKMNTSEPEFMAIYPNPAWQKINIAINWDKEEYCRLELFDLKGVSIGSKNIHMMKGLNKFDWDCNSLPTGVYTIKIIGSKVNSMFLIKNNN